MSCFFPTVSIASATAVATLASLGCPYRKLESYRKQGVTTAIARAYILGGSGVNGKEF